MTENDFLLEIEKLNLEISEEKLNKLNILFIELEKYNMNVNLTRIIEKKDVYLKHYYDSLSILKIIDLNQFNNLIDVGTGAGFPGLVLAIFFPNLNITLLDSNVKKIEWLKYISNILDLNVEIVYDRIENYSKENLNKFDIVTSRAVANLRVLSELSIPLVKKEGYFVPLKGNIENELKEAEETIKLLNCGIEDKIEFYLMNNAGIRNILKIKKNVETLNKELRSYDKILKKPLKKKVN